MTGRGFSQWSFRGRILSPITGWCVTLGFFLLLGFSIQIALGFAGGFRLLQKGRETPGTVVQTWVPVPPRDIYDPRVEYSLPDGRKFQITPDSRLYPGLGRNLLLHQQVTVLYDEAHPEKAILKDPPRFWRDFALALVCIPASLYACLLLTLAFWKGEGRFQSWMIRVPPELNRKMNRSFYATIMVFSIGASLFIVRQMIGTGLFCSKAVETQGAIEGIREHGATGFGNSFVLYLRVGFTDAAGRKFEFFSRSYPYFMYFGLQTGGTRVLYNPQNPGQARMKTFYQLWGHDLVLLCLWAFPPYWVLRRHFMIRRLKGKLPPYSVTLGKG